MKKIIILILLILGIYYLSEDNYDLSKDAIRFRVIANSNSTIDILIKEKVVNKLSTLLFDKEETKKLISVIRNTNKNAAENILWKKFCTNLRERSRV